MDKKKQIHVEIPADMHQRILDLCPETGQISILTRKLFRAFLNKMSISEAAGEVADDWKGDEY